MAAILVLTEMIFLYLFIWSLFGLNAWFHPHNQSWSTATAFRLTHSVDNLGYVSCSTSEALAFFLVVTCEKKLAILGSTFKKLVALADSNIKSTMILWHYTLYVYLKFL